MVNYIKIQETITIISNCEVMFLISLLLIIILFLSLKIHLLMDSYFKATKRNLNECLDN